MAVTDRLLTTLRNDLAGATDAQIIAKLWQVVDIACREGWIWRETITIPLLDGVQNYASITPSGTEIIQALSVDHETLDMYGTVYEYGTLTLGTEPTAGDVAEGDLYMVAVLAPATTAGEDIEPLIPSDLWTSMHDLWWKGTMGLMTMQVGRPYSNPAFGQIYYKAFKSKLAEEKRKIDTGGGIGAQMWTYPRWA
jgi:hypothetical protein